MEVTTATNHHVGLDAGAKFIKIVVHDEGEEISEDILESPFLKGTELRLEFNDGPLKGTLHGVITTYAKLAEVKETKFYQRLQKRLKENKQVNATGGGSWKYNETVNSQLNIEIHNVRESLCMVTGIDHIYNFAPDTFYRYLGDDITQIQQPSLEELATEVDDFGGNLYPYMLVNIRSGLSLWKVSGPGQFERVTGSHIGGTTILGLAKMMTGVSSFGEMIKVAFDGDSNLVDMTVGDIYGKGYLGLQSSMIASSFGKLITKSREEVQDKDLLRSLAVMITVNITQISALTAKSEGLPRIIMVGYQYSIPHFLKWMQIMVKYWSQGSVKLTFSKHAPYLGVIGTLLHD